MRSKGKGGWELESGNGDKIVIGLKERRRAQWEKCEVRESNKGKKKKSERTADLNGYASAGNCHLFPFQILSRFRIPARLPCLYFTPLRAWQLWWSLRMMKMIVTMRHIMCCHCVAHPLILLAWHISAPYDILIYPHRLTMSVGKSHYIYYKPVQCRDIVLQRRALKGNIFEIKKRTKKKTWKLSMHLKCTLSPCVA